MKFQYRRQYQGKIQGVVFDWAGTIVDYGSCAPVGAFVKLFNNHGISLALDEARGPMGTEKKAHIRALLKLDNISTQWKSRKGQSWTETDVNQLYQEFIPLQLKILSEYSEVIPGAKEAFSFLRSRGIKIGTTTGYNSEMLSVVAKCAEQQGLVPDCLVSASEVPAARPEPWMALECAKKLRIFPMESMIKVGDTIADIEEGLNAGMWAVGVAQTGNEVGLSFGEIRNLTPDELNSRLVEARDRLLKAGAHFVIDSVNDISFAVEEIESYLAQGDHP